MLWSNRATGDYDDDCFRTFTGAECKSRPVRAKSLKLILAQAATGKALAETTATIHSNHAQYSRESFHALCTAAFYDFPKPLSNTQFDVPVE
jgi:hypothetical protein